jgi:hypothetical protein
MSSTNSPRATLLGRYLAKALDYAVHYAVEIFLIALIIYLCVSRGLSVRVDVYEPLDEGAAMISEANLGAWFADVGSQTFSFVSTMLAPPKTKSSPKGVPTAQLTKGQEDFNDVALTDDPAPHISNLTLVLSPDYGERKGLPAEIIEAKKARVTNYLERYAGIAKREMELYGIPASITLAQGLLESNAGDSKLAVNSNNHFGIKCKKKCLGCTCRNYSDDSRYDMFRVFQSAAESFREHSELLSIARYAKLKAYGTDYKKWAHGLKKCGYATDPNYGKKLITIIENLELNKFDDQVVL